MRILEISYSMLRKRSSSVSARGRGDGLGDGEGVLGESVFSPKLGYRRRAGSVAVMG